MKTKLLSLILPMVFFTLVSNAQTKTWTFEDTNVWSTTGVPSGGPAVVIDNLTCVPHTTSANNFAAQSAGNITYSDSFAGTTILKINGSGGAAAGTFLPTVRFFYFHVDGPCTFKVWFKHGSSSGVDRTVFLTDGNSAIGSQAAAFSSTAILSATITTAGNYYLYADNNVSISKMEATGANVTAATLPPLSVNNLNVDSAAKVFSNGKQIFVSNIKSNTQVDVFSLTGALVKSINTDSDTSFELATSGLYIVTVKSAEGTKSVKVSVN